MCSNVRCDADLHPVMRAEIRPTWLAGALLPREAGRLGSLIAV